MKTNFVKAYKEILRCSLEPHVKWVLLVLLDRQEEDRWPVSYSVLGQEAGGISRSSAFRAVNLLIRAGLVKCVTQGRKGGHYDIVLFPGDIVPLETLPTENSPPVPSGTLSSHPDTHPRLRDNSRHSEKIDLKRTDPTDPAKIYDTLVKSTNSIEDRPPSEDELNEDPVLTQSPTPLVLKTGPNPLPSEEKPPIDKARLNGWHQAEVDYYRKFWPGRQPEEFPARTVGDGESAEWPCKWERFKKLAWVDKAGNELLPDAIEEEKRKQELFKAHQKAKGNKK